MGKRINCVMLVDDNPDDNFYHERIIKMYKFTECVIIKESGIEALEYLNTLKDVEDNKLDLIFLDINMPGMNGWEFLNEFSKLSDYIKSKLIIVMLTTSDNPDDVAKSKKWNFVSDYKTKPLTKEMMEEILDKYFS